MHKTKFVAPIQPEYVRLPASGQVEPYSGLNRSALERLVLPLPLNNYKPPVQSKLFNPSGMKRWIRLIYFRSLMDYLAKLPDGMNAKQQRYVRKCVRNRKPKKEAANA